MTAETHPDPFQDAMGHGLQRAMQVASCAVTAAQVYAYQQRTQAMAAAERDERARRALNTQIRAEREAARAGWAPALDPDWLAPGRPAPDRPRLGRRRCPTPTDRCPGTNPPPRPPCADAEERLRDLHPYAMARYDRLREDGAAQPTPCARPHRCSPAPRAHDDRPYTPRPALAAGNGESVIWTAAAAAPGPGEADRPGSSRGAGTRGASRSSPPCRHEPAPSTADPLGEAEQRTVLETITNLPADVIDHVVQPAGAAGSPARNSAGASPATADAPPAAPAAPPMGARLPRSHPGRRRHRRQLPRQSTAAARPPAQRRSPTAGTAADLLHGTASPGD